MEQDIKNQIDQVVDNIYKYDITKTMTLMKDLFSSIYVSLQKNEFKNVNVLNQILILMEESMSNKDYLLLADILKYELIPIVPEKYIN